MNHCMHKFKLLNLVLALSGLILFFTILHYLLLLESIKSNDCTIYFPLGLQTYYPVCLGADIVMIWPYLTLAEHTVFLGSSDFAHLLYLPEL